MTVDTRLFATLGAFLLAYYSYTTFSSKRRPSMSEAASQGTFEPSVADLVVVKAMLSKGLRLPPELIDTITDLAEYWPHTTTELLPDPGSNDAAVARGHTPGGGQEDVFLVRTPPLGLPSWPRDTRAEDGSPISRKPPIARPAGEEYSTDDFQKLIASPVDLLAHPCRRIVFTIKSHDQGWGGTFEDHGTYRHSWTWFDVGLERWCKTTGTSPENSGQHETQQQQAAQPSFQPNDLCTVLPEVVWNSEADSHLFVHPLHPSDNTKIQSNVVAERDAREHVVVWNHTDDVDPERDAEPAAKLAEQGRGEATADGRFVRDLKLGDVVTVWAKARFAGWANFVQSVQVKVYYAV